MVLRVGLQVVNVDVGQAGEEQLQLLLVEDGDQPEKDNLVKDQDVERYNVTSLG